jgi:large subunit ribosomal protein L25
MAEVRIAAEDRTEFGKGVARRLRRDKKVPAVLYGHGEAVRHVSLPGHELMKALKTPNVLLDIVLPSGNQLALPKSVQRDPIRRDIEHVDLVAVRRGEMVVVEVPVHTTGAPIGGGVLEVVFPTLSVQADATSIPAEFVVDVDKTEAGFSVNAGDIELPAGVELAVEADLMILHIVAPQSAGGAEEGEAEIGEVAAETAAAED